MATDAKRREGRAPLDLLLALRSKDWAFHFPGFLRGKKTNKASYGYSPSVENFLCSYCVPYGLQIESCPREHIVQLNKEYIFLHATLVSHFASHNFRFKMA